MRDLLQSPQLPPIASLVALLINDLAVLDLPLILVLDDYQFISLEVVHDILQTLLERQPPTMHTVVCTRQDLPVPLPRLRARGQVTEIRERDLRFTEAEAADFVDRTMGLHLDADVVRALEGRTEGWIAGLQLAALALQEHQGDAQAFVASFTGDDRYIMDYMLAEVLSSSRRRSAILCDRPRSWTVLPRLCAMRSRDARTARLCSSGWRRPTCSWFLSIIAANGIAITASLPSFCGPGWMPDTRKRLHRRAMLAYQAASDVPGYMQQAIGHALAYAALPREPRVGKAEQGSSESGDGTMSGRMRNG